MTATATPFADLAESVLALAREIRIHEYAANASAALTSANAGVLRHLEAHPGATPSETADATGLLRSNLSAVLRELERSGMVERRNDETDRRSVRLFLTDTAVRTRVEIRAEWERIFEYALAGSDGVPESRAVLERLTAELVTLRLPDQARGARPTAGGQ
jgi:DNA-binding MarR family transcriptional regulator